MKWWLTLLLVPFLMGCHSSSNLHHFRGISHTHPFHIQVGHPLKKSEKRKIQHLLSETFTEVDQIYNHWNPQSELSRLNSFPPFQAVTISLQLLELLHKGSELTTLTQGRYDPTLGRAIQVWKTHLQLGFLPQQSLTIGTGWDQVTISRDQVSKFSPNLEFDFDGILKGKTVDTLIEKLQQMGHENLYVEWAGDLRVSGQHPEGRPWQVLLQATNQILSLDNEALATSGDQQQSWQIDSYGTYTHIIDPETKQPIQTHPHSLAAVSVKAPTCVFGRWTCNCLHDVHIL